MDLLGKHPQFDIYGKSGNKIYARNTAKPATFISKSAELHECFISEGCEVYGTIDHSVVSTGCVIGKGAEVTDSVIMPDTVIREGSTVTRAITGEQVTIGKKAVVGLCDEGEEPGITVIGTGKVVEDNQVVKTKEIL